MRHSVSDASVKLSQLQWQWQQFNRMFLFNNKNEIKRVIQIKCLNVWQSNQMLSQERDVKSLG